MNCPKCSRKRYAEKVIKRVKRNFMVRVCLGCETQYDLKEVKRSKIINEWVEKDAED
jgi:uncharacterized Zn finger protein